MKNSNFQNSGFRIPSNCVNCYRCGGSNHNSLVCLYIDKICNYSGKLGHKAKVCHCAHKQRTSQPLHNASQHSRIKQHNAQHHLESEPETNSPEEIVNLLTSPRVLAHHVSVEVNGHNLQLELDTGSANTVVSERTCFAFTRCSKFINSSTTYSIRRIFNSSFRIGSNYHEV